MSLTYRCVETMHELRTNFGSALKQARESAGLTQHELSEMIMVPPKFVRYYEKGITEPSIGIAILIMDALEIDLEDIHHL